MNGLFRDKEFYGIAGIKDQFKKQIQLDLDKEYPELAEGKLHDYLREFRCPTTKSDKYYKTYLGSDLNKVNFENLLSTVLSRRYEAQRKLEEQVSNVIEATAKESSFKEMADVVYEVIENMYYNNKIASFDKNNVIPKITNSEVKYFLEADKRNFANVMNNLFERELILRQSKKGKMTTYSLPNKIAEETYNQLEKLQQEDVVSSAVALNTIEGFPKLVTPPLVTPPSQMDEIKFNILEDYKKLSVQERMKHYSDLITLLNK